MPQCLVCEQTVEPFLSFGRMPLGNGFLMPDQFEDEYFFNLEVAFCSGCGMVQLLEQPDRERMFHDEYAYFSSTSAGMVRHFQEFAGHVRDNVLTSSDPFVVEIGSNDGIMLKNFAADGMRHLGIEPSANVAQAAIDNGVRTECRFFDEDCASDIVSGDGQADAILAANVICHIPYLDSVFGGVRRLLKPGGRFMFEDPWLGDIIDKTAYDQIYDEHVFYFSVTSLRNLAQRHGLDVVDAQPQWVHGGSMRYVLAHDGSCEPSAAVTELLAKETELGLANAETFETFRASVEASREQLVELLERLRDEGQRVVGYGATSKSTTVLNYCGITPEHIEFISDTTPIKQGRFTPGAHIPVRAYDEFVADYPDYAVLFAWNHAKEIMAREEAFRAAGGQWIRFVPSVGIES